MCLIPPRTLLRLSSALLSAAVVAGAHAQMAIALPQVPAPSAAAAEAFHFATDAPKGPGWSRPDEPARFYIHEQLPEFFSRTLTLAHAIPSGATLQWIFTGPHAGFTIELGANKLRLYQRFYDSSALYSGQGSYPEKITLDEERAFTGTPQTLTVISDAHLSIIVLLNGQPILTQRCLFDVTRQQLAISGSRSQHLVIDGALLTAPAETTTITVDPRHTFQTILGFGGSPSIPAYDSLNDAGKARYFEILKRYNLLIHREYPVSSELKADLSNYTDLASATPHYYGGNFPNGEVSDFDYSRHILSLGGSVLYEVWSLPSWATVANTAPGKPLVDTWNKPIRRVADPEKYATILVTYCKLAKEKTGQAPQIVGVENEVDQPTDVFAAMTTTLRKRLDEAGFQSTRIQIADASFLYLGVDRANALHEHPEAWRDTDYIAAHQYDYQQFLANPDLYDERLQAMHAAARGKPFLATEICLNDPHFQEASFRLAFAIAELYHKDLTELDAESLMYCWLILDVEQPSFGASRSLLVPDRTDGNMPVASSFQLRALGAFSRHLPAGMKRIALTSSNPDLLASAYANGKDTTLILLNRSTSPQRIHLNWPGVQFTEQETTSLYSANSEQAAASDIVVEPGSIITLSTLHIE